MIENANTKLIDKVALTYSNQPEVLLLALPEDGLKPGAVNRLLGNIKQARDLQQIVEVSSVSNFNESIDKRKNKKPDNNQIEL